MNMESVITNSLKDSQEALNLLLENDIAIQNVGLFAKKICDSINNDGRIFSCGNGGSMSDAMHFSEELTGRFRKNRKALPAIAISDPGHITCVANDFGYEYIFSRYLEAHASSKDVLFAISTSGNSKNVIKALEYARENEIFSVVLTGKKKCTASELANLMIVTEGRGTDRVQELHIKVIHILIELVEREFFPENYFE